MSKRREMKEIVNLMVIALRHKIGAKVDPTAQYAKKYLNEAETAISHAKEIAISLHLNKEDKKELEDGIRKKLQKELETRTYIPQEKFSLMEQEITSALTVLNLS